MSEMMMIHVWKRRKKKRVKITLERRLKYQDYFKNNKIDIIIQQLPVLYNYLLESYCEYNCYINYKSDSTFTKI